jgi:hypothetical protein
MSRVVVYDHPIPDIEAYLNITRVVVFTLLLNVPLWLPLLARFLVKTLKPVALTRLSSNVVSILLTSKALASLMFA